MKAFINSRAGVILTTVFFGFSVYAGVLAGLPH